MRIRAEKGIFRISEECTHELIQMIEEITPEIDNLEKRLTMIKRLIFGMRISPEERILVRRLVADIFKYSMCIGFDPLINKTAFIDEDDGSSGEKAVEDADRMEMMIRGFHKEHPELFRWVQMIKISEVIDCGMSAGLLMWKIFITVVSIVFENRESDTR